MCVAMQDDQVVHARLCIDYCKMVCLAVIVMSRLRLVAARCHCRGLVGL